MCAHFAIFNADVRAQRIYALAIYLYAVMFELRR